LGAGAAPHPHGKSPNRAADAAGAFTTPTIPLGFWAARLYLRL